MSAIHRLNLAVEDYQDVTLTGPPISVAACRDGSSDRIDLWYEHTAWATSKEDPGITRGLYIFGTGHPTPWSIYTRGNWTFIGTVVTPSGLVWHVYIVAARGEADLLMIAPKQGRVQIIVDGQTWFDHPCDSRQLNVGMVDGENPHQRDMRSRVTFAAEFPCSLPALTGLAGATGTVLDGILRKTYSHEYRCEDCGFSETKDFDTAAERDAYETVHHCPIYVPNEAELMAARGAICSLIGNIALAQIQPSAAVMDEIAKSVVVAMRWRPIKGECL